MTENKLPNLDQALASIVLDLDALAQEHGQEVMDLALTAVQLDAAKNILLEFIVFASSVFFLSVLIGWWKAPRTKEAKRDLDHEARSVGLAVGTIVCSISAIVSFVGFLSPVKWMAVFGNPEVLIATNVLKAAGLI